MEKTIKATKAKSTRSELSKTTVEMFNLSKEIAALDKEIKERDQEADNMMEAFKKDGTSFLDAEKQLSSWNDETDEMQKQKQEKETRKNQLQRSSRDLLIRHTHETYPDKVLPNGNTIDAYVSNMKDIILGASDATLGRAIIGKPQYVKGIAYVFAGLLVPISDVELEDPKRSMLMRNVYQSGVARKTLSYVLPSVAKQVEVKKGESAKGVTQKWHFLETSAVKNATYYEIEDFDRFGHGWYVVMQDGTKKPSLTGIEFYELFKTDLDSYIPLMPRDHTDEDGNEVDLIEQLHILLDSKGFTHKGTEQDYSDEQNQSVSLDLYTKNFGKNNPLFVRLYYDHNGAFVDFVGLAHDSFCGLCLEDAITILRDKIKVYQKVYPVPKQLEGLKATYKGSKLKKA